MNGKQPFYEGWAAADTAPDFEPSAPFPYGDVFRHLDTREGNRHDHISNVLAAALAAALPRQPVADHEILAVIGGRFIAVIHRHNPTLIQRRQAAIAAAKRIGLLP